MTAVLRTCPAAGIAEINSKHNRLSGSQLPQVDFPHTVHGKNKDPNLYPRTRCSASLNTAGMPINMQTRKQVPSLPSEHPQEATNSKGSRAWGKETPLHSRWKGTLTTRYNAISECLKIHYQERLGLSSVTLCDPRGLPRVRLPCPSPTPEACSNMSIELVMPSNHLIFCCPVLLLPSIFPSIRVFWNKSAICIR